LIFISTPIACKNSDFNKEEKANFKMEREELVQILKKEGIDNPMVLSALKKVERHQFVPKALSPMSYANRPLPIGEGQTISQPYIVGFMTQVLNLSGDEKVLEIGTGSGYQAAVLAEVSKLVYSIEIVPVLAQRSRKLLKKLGYNNITVIEGDGYKGLAEKQPFDAIIVTCAPENIPKPLIKQLKVGGRMIIPVGPVMDVQYLVLVEKEAENKLKKTKVLPVRFVPMTGKAQEKDK